MIGINSQIETGGNGGGNVGIGFAIPIDTASALLPELEKNGRVDRGFLGVDALTIDASLSDLNLPVDHGVLVQTVTPESPAAKAGIAGGNIIATLDGNQIRLGGDIITSVDGKKIRTRDDLANFIVAPQAGREGQDRRRPRRQGAHRRGHPRGPPDADVRDAIARTMQA